MNSRSAPQDLAPIWDEGSSWPGLRASWPERSRICKKKNSVLIKNLCGSADGDDHIELALAFLDRPPKVVAHLRNSIALVIQHGRPRT